MLPLILAGIGGWLIGDSLKSKEVFADGGVMAKGGIVDIAISYGEMLNELSKEKQFNKKIEKKKQVDNFAKSNGITMDSNNIIYINGEKVAYIDKINEKTGQEKANWSIKKYADGGTIYKMAEEMTDAEYDKKFSQLSEKQKSSVKSLIRLGDTPKLALATILSNKDIDENSDTWNLYRYADGGMMAKGGYVEVVLNEGNGKVINQLYNQWNNVKDEKEYAEWVKKVKSTKFGTYGTIGIPEVLDKFNFDNAPINSFHLKTFKAELKNALK